MRWEGILLVTYFGDGTLGTNRIMGCVLQVLWGAKCTSEIRQRAVHSEQCTCILVCYLQQGAELVFSWTKP